MQLKYIFPKIDMTLSLAHELLTHCINSGNSPKKPVVKDEDEDDDEDEDAADDEDDEDDEDADEFAEEDDNEDNDPIL